MQMQPLQTYPGRKGAAGVCQHIISEIPNCKIFIDAMCGSGIVGSQVKADTVVFNDIDESIINKIYPLGNDGIYWNEDYKKVVEHFDKKQGVVFYFDPPYLLDTRYSQVPIYSFEWNEQDHIAFLEVVQKIKSAVIISHYPCSMYDVALSSWRKKEFQAMTHAGVRTEALYMNYKQPVLLQHWEHVGKNFTDRQRIKRKISRLINRLNNEAENERAAILSAVVQHFQYIKK